MADVQVRDNREENRFEAEVDGHVAVAEYQRLSDCLRFTHTVVPPELSGQGIGSRLAHAGMASAREQGLMVQPQCSFIAAYMRKHPECHDLVHPDYRDAVVS